MLSDLGSGDLNALDADYHLTCLVSCYNSARRSELGALLKGRINSERLKENLRIQMPDLCVYMDGSGETSIQQRCRPCTKNDVVKY